ncbi:hypothetical protein ABD76_27670 [Paenibacillus dendritiformis]|nr:hypothetical protein [Paenibacillus dendritiformis]
MKKRLIASLVSVSMAFAVFTPSLFALSARAEAAATPAKGSVSLSQQQVSVRDIVPSEYLSKYAGKFSSYAEVNKDVTAKLELTDSAK